MIPLQIARKRLHVQGVRNNFLLDRRGPSVARSPRRATYIAPKGRRLNAMRLLIGCYDGFTGLIGLHSELQVKSADVVAKKWAARAGAAGQDYAAGVQGTTKDWAADTAAAAPAWGAGVQAAVANGSFAKGVNAAGTAKWKTKASSVGASRYPTGVSAAAPYYQAGIQGVLATLSGLTLPARGPKGDPGNLQRVAVVAQALRKMKTG